MKTILLMVLTMALGVWTASADEAPIAGTVKTVDVGAQTLTLEVASKGKTREVIVYMKPGPRLSGSPGRRSRARRASSSRRYRSAH